jgi:hypothetical protein
MISPDKLSAIAYHALRLLLIRNPQRVSWGIFLGFFIYFLVILFSPSLREITGVDFANAPAWGWIVLGVFMVNWREVWHLSQVRAPLGEEFEDAFETMRRGNFSDTERRAMCRKLVRIAFDRAGTSSSTIVPVVGQGTSEGPHEQP